MLTARTELTDLMLIFGERHLRRVWTGMPATTTATARTAPASYDHPTPGQPATRIRRRTRLAGLLNEYEPAA